jgi:serine phosphatase RsbU (regulator of sigma subunit)
VTRDAGQGTALDPIRHSSRFYIAACDSTGHGVPGAFMSLLNISFLNEAVNEKNILEPHEILNHVRKRLIENMDGGQDGMDAILLCIEFPFGQASGEKLPLKKGAGGIKITYAAANNSPSIIKNGTLISLPADKMPVGKGEIGESFTLRTIDVEKDDTIYLYTDGYADQFGGPKGKKFKYKQLDELLVSISNKHCAEQSEILNQRFEDWKAWPNSDGVVRNLEQVDDILVIGIRI